MWFGFISYFTFDGLSAHKLLKITEPQASTVEMRSLLARKIKSTEKQQLQQHITANIKIKFKKKNLSGALKPQAMLLSNVRYLTSGVLASISRMHSVWKVGGLATCSHISHTFIYGIGKSLHTQFKQISVTRMQLLSFCVLKISLRLMESCSHKGILFCGTSPQAATHISVILPVDELSLKSHMKGERDGQI